MGLILGVSCFYHDSAAALLKDGEVLFAAQEERFTRKKHDSAFPFNAVKAAMESAQIRIEDLEAVAYYEKPLLKFERVLTMAHDFAPFSRKQFVASMPSWIKEKLFFKKKFWEHLEKVNGRPITKKPLLLFPEHHLSHAASAFYPSGFEDAAVLVLDGVGELASMSAGEGSGKDIKFFRQIHYPHSLGMLYSAFTYFLGFKVNSGEYKLMGLAPYGNSQDSSTKEYARLIKERMVKVDDNGTFELKLEWFEYQRSMRMFDDKKWEGLFGFPRRTESDPLEQKHMNLAFAIQQVLEEAALKLASWLRRRSGRENLVMCGGVALNCVSNARLEQENIFKNIWIQPASGDAGGALGAALAAHHIYFQRPRNITAQRMDHAFLGPGYSEDLLETFIKSRGVKAVRLDDQNLIQSCAEILNDGKVLGWFQGRMEWGPRALGHRSVLADPRRADAQKQLNLKIKYREGFRPFAPIMTEKACADLFENPQGAYPYMLFVLWLKQSRRREKPDGYENFDLYQKLYFQRSELPAVTHIDYSARVQTVDDNDKKTRDLLVEFGKLSGFEVLVNTSFNVRGEPIVCSPRDAYLTFMQTEMDYLALGNFLIKKTDQKDWDDKDLWSRSFGAD